jgi:hypothetical protein
MLYYHVLRESPISWVERKELVDLGVSSNQGKVPVFGTVLEFDEEL